VAEIRPRAGVGIDRDDAERRIVAALRSGTADLGALRIGPTRPAIGPAEVAAAARSARRLLAAPVQIVTGASTLTLQPTDLGPTLRTQIVNSRLTLRVDVASLRAALGPALVAVETVPKDATFAVSGTTVSIVPSVDGVTVGLTRVADEIARGHHHVIAPTRTTPPARTTEWAQNLNITELVYSFTTQHPCCQPRVDNIHLAADTINGTIVEPGQTFSLNGALGPRTTEKGYKLAPGIGANLEFEDSVGGGVSQLSTTLFNAVFFGCYEDVTHTVHALYISRYPMGREATLNYPSIDNKFRNDSPFGVLIRTSYSGTSVTVSLYGNKGGRTCTADGPHVLQTIPIEPEYIDDPALPVGTQKLISHGSTGYVVENFRIIHYGDNQQPDIRQRFRERYSMAKAKIARGTGLPTTTTTVPPPPVAPPATPPPS
jgi:vancomycin resistance protein YoaR